MAGYIDQKKDEWSGQVAAARTKDRSQYPGGPSASPAILATYARLINSAIAGKQAFTACVLGATPELRDMVLERGGNLTTLDISDEMIAKCAPLMRHQENTRETVRIASWLDASLPAAAFDLVLGDGASNNIPPDKQTEFFANLRRLLRPGGTLVLREGVIHPDRPVRTVAEISREFDEGGAHWFDTFYDLYLYSELTPRYRDPETSRTNLGAFWEEIRQARESGGLGQAAFEAMWWFRGKIIHTIYLKPELEKLMAGHFFLSPVAPDPDHLRMTKDSWLFFAGRPRNP